MSTTPFGVVADDLTGAGDTGVQFARVGLAVRLLFDDPTEVDETADVTVRTTDSRGLPPDEAAGRVHATVAELVAAGVGEIYKKIDSTLRGNLAVEIEAALAALPTGTTALVCPAFPAMGRRLVGGHLLVDHELVTRTAAGRDPVTPVATADVVGLLRAAGIEVAAIGADVVAAGDAALTAALAASSSKTRAVVIDAVSDADLRAVAAASRRLTPRPMCVGSAGLAAALAPHWLSALRSGMRSSHPGLVIVASVHDVARAQLRRLTEERQLPVLTLDTASENRARERWARDLETLENDVRQRAGLVLTTPEETGALSAATVATLLAEAAREACRRFDAVGMVATGGDAARALLAAFEARGITLEDEIASGVPIGRLVAGHFPNLTIVTKAGGFGDADTLSRAFDAVTRRRAPR